MSQPSQLSPAFNAQAEKLFLLDDSSKAEMDAYKAMPLSTKVFFWTVYVPHCVVGAVTDVVVGAGHRLGKAVGLIESKPKTGFAQLYRHIDTNELYISESALRRTNNALRKGFLLSSQRKRMIDAYEQNLSALKDHSALMATGRLTVQMR